MQTRGNRLEILSHVLGREKSTIDLETLVMTSEEESLVGEMETRLLQGEPLAQVLGYVDFFGCRIEVTREALIPRLESEILVEKVLLSIPEEDDGVLLDLCTGTGCLGLAIKKHRPKLTVILSDISPSATRLARKNAAANDLMVEILEGDLFTPLGGQKIDYLIANPPYITEREYSELEESVRLFEPKLALVGGEDGLLFYKRIKDVLDDYLMPGGKAFFEIGSSQGEKMLSLFEGFPEKRVLLDWAGHSRFFFLEKLP